jgi:hypothetical protein
MFWSLAEGANTLVQQAAGVQTFMSSQVGTQTFEGGWGVQHKCLDPKAGDMYISVPKREGGLKGLGPKGGGQGSPKRGRQQIGP